MTSALIVINQVGLMFALIATGFLAAKLRWLGSSGVRDLNKVLLYIVMPMVVLNLLNTPSSPNHTKNLLLALALAIVCHLLAIFLSKRLFRRYPDDTQVICRSASVLSNSAFMAIPLIHALVGEIGTLYLIPYLIVFNVTSWTFGVRIMAPEDQKPSIRQLLLNPTLIAVAVGLLIYITQISIPPLLSDLIHLISNTNAPFAMILIGAQIALMKPPFLPSRAVWLQILLKNLLIPLLMLPLILLVTRDKTLVYATIIPVGAPTAATVVLFATRFERDVRLAAEAMAHSTVISIISLSGIVLLTEWLLEVLA